LAGTIPAELGNLVNLHHMDLRNNTLTGDVPIEFTNLVNLCESGNLDYPCWGRFGLNLGYNHLTVPASDPDVADFLEVKDPDWYLTQAVEQEVPNTGGTILSNDGNTEIVIPAGAGNIETIFLFDPQPNPSEGTGGLAFAGNSFELTARQGETPVSSFGQPLTLTLRYDPNLLGPIPEDSLILYYWNDGLSAWVDAVTTCEGGEFTRDIEANLLRLQICHLSEFALMGKAGYGIYLPMVNR